MNETRARFLLGIGLPVTAFALAVVPYLVVRNDLPDRLATHFDASGSPDGSMAPGMFLLATLLMVGVGAALCVWLARNTKPLPASVAPLVGFLAGFFAGIGAGIGAVTVVQQRGLENWAEADGVAALVVVPLVVSLAAAAVAARAAAALPVRAFTPGGDAQPKMDLAPGQHAVWAETVHSVWLERLGAAAIALGVIAALATVWWLIFPTVAIGFLILSLATLRVRADRQGLRVRYGLLPWPTTHVAVGDMAAASVIDVRPMEWGGWGYRGSLKLMKQAAVVHRAGPGIRLDLHDGKVFVVTVDDPDTAVALLNAEIARSPQPA